MVAEPLQASNLALAGVAPVAFVEIRRAEVGVRGLTRQQGVDDGQEKESDPRPRRVWRRAVQPIGGTVRSVRSP